METVVERALSTTETKVEEEENDMIVQIPPQVNIKVEKNEVPMYDNDNIDNSG